MSAKPFATNFVTGACLAGLGDVLCQKIALRVAGGGKLFDERNWDARRTLNISLIRACLIVPFIMFWYARLGQIFPGHDMAQRIQRVLLNEAVGGPVMITFVFVGNAILRGEWSLSGLYQRFRDEFFPTLKKGVTYWPLVHFLGTFRLPVKHQPLFAHVASVYWNGVLSFHAHKAKDH
jgi:hypothetical protein